MYRRQFLQAFGVGAAAISSGALAQALAALPEGALMPDAQSRDPGMHAIARLTYGVTPELYTHVQQIGAQAFIEEQLAPDALDDSALEPRLADWMSILNESSADLLDQYQGMRRPVAGALVASVVLRAVYSQRQLYERMVYFFSNHFHVYIGKGPVLFLKPDDDRSAMRPNAMTNFRQILGASAKSPAMLLFLDNAESNRTAPNENYARELMELHTLSVEGGYSETDVKEVARAFTGWSVRGLREGGDALTYRYRRGFHDNGAKTILGMTLPPGGGESDGERVLDLLAGHPSTAQFISTKLARRFVVDSPPESLINTLVATFQNSDGDVKTLLRTLFASQEFWSAPPKLKHPLEYVASILRALAFDVTNSAQFIRAISGALDALGDIPFAWPAPNGYPDVAGAWKDGLINRWNAALAAASGSIPGGQNTPQQLIDLMERNGIALEVEPVLFFLGEYLFGRSLTADEQGIVMDFARGASDTAQVQIAFGLALLLASPAFQYR